MVAISPGSEIYLTQILQLLSRIGVGYLDSVVRRAVRLADEKGIPVNHVLAELLIYYYLLGCGYRYVTIEESVGMAKCDVYAEKEGFDVCVEIDFYSIPQNFILNRTKYILARHIKKVLQIVKSGIKAVIFAYPYGYIPLIPIELIKPINSRSRKRLLNIASTIREILTLDNDDIEYLMKAYINSILIFDTDGGKVYELSPQDVEKLMTLYSSYVEGVSL